MKITSPDQDVLLSLYGGCRESMNEVFREFLGSYHSLEQNLRAAFGSGDMAALKKMLHFHGPSFMYIGFPQVSAMFKSLENACVRAENNLQVSAEYTALMQAVRDSFESVSCEAACYSNAV